MKTTPIQLLRNLAVVGVMLTTVSLHATLIGTYELDYYHNAAGRYTDQSNSDLSMANPYYGNLIAPGPIFINAAPGIYDIVLDAGVGHSIWSGDALGGTWLSSGTPGEAVELNHAFGQIALYFWDWYPYDNDPNQKAIVSVYSRDAAVPDAGLTAAMLAIALGGMALLRRKLKS